METGIRNFLFLLTTHAHCELSRAWLSPEEIGQVTYEFYWEDLFAEMDTDNHLWLMSARITNVRLMGVYTNGTPAKKEAMR